MAAISLVLHLFFLLGGINERLKAPSCDLQALPKSPRIAAQSDLSTDDRSTEAGEDVASDDWGSPMTDNVVAPTFGSLELADLLQPRCASPRLPGGVCDGCRARARSGVWRAPIASQPAASLFKINDWPWMRRDL